jgi:radical SAM superfamily enzyme YgiQ (UPF0313 family)
MPDPDRLPLPRRDLVAHLKDRYYYLLHQPVATLKTTWGCWYQCNFCCTWKVTNGIAYSRSPESIVSELEQIDAEEVYIVDDIFLIHPMRLARIAQLLRERRIQKKFLVYGRADFITEHEAVIREWAALGLRAVIVGLEAATDAELQALDKRCTVDCNRRAIGILRKHGIDTYASLIPRPDYTPADWLRLRHFIEAEGLYYVNISPLTPMPGTRAWTTYEKQITVSRKAHGLWDLSHCVLPTRMPLKQYYRSLLRLYARTVLDVRRVNRLGLRARSPAWSFKYVRIWFGALRVLIQFLNIHHHHDPRNLARAMAAGPTIPTRSPAATGEVGCQGRCGKENLP